MSGKIVHNFPDRI